MAQAAKTELRTVSDYLKQQRKRQKLTIESVSKDICVRSCFLQALEDGRFKDLPELTFALGFVKAYAKLLDLDQKQVAAQFKTEYLAAQDGAPEAISAPSVIEPSSKHAALDRSYKFSVKPRRRWPAWASPIVGLVGAGLSWMWLGASSATLTTTASLDPATDARVLAALAEPAIESAETVILEVDQVTEVPPSTGSYFIPAANASSSEPIGPSKDTVVIEASEDSWLQLSYSDGTELWSGVLRAGQTYQPKLIGDVFLTTSNAGGIMLKQHNQSRGPLGARGEVLDSLDLTNLTFASNARRNLQLTAEAPNEAGD